MKHSALLISLVVLCSAGASADQPLIPQMPGFPIELESAGAGKPRWNVRGVVLADLDGEGSLEVVYSTQPCLPPSCEEGQVFAWDASGTVKPGFPYEAPEYAGDITMVTVADTDGDGLMEVFADAMLEDAFACEFDVAAMGDHRAGLGPNHAVQVDFQHAFAFQLEHPLAAILLNRAVDKVLNTVTCHGPLLS